MKRRRKYQRRFWFDIALAITAIAALIVILSILDDLP
jgi:hypothetical protein